MAGVLDSVDQRTQLAGANRLELLMFRLTGSQLFGINVFKVQEVIQCPPLTHVPQSNPMVKGIANMRGKTIPIMDLSMAIGRMPITDLKNSYIIVTEYNRTVQGFLVGSVDRIVNMQWKDILPPPKGAGGDAYLTAVTNVDSKLVEIIDVEKVLDQVIHINTDVSQEMLDHEVQSAKVRHVLVADDSSVARSQIKRALDQVGLEVTMCKDGKEAFEQLKAWEKEGPVNERIGMVLSDIEMPEMDGYTLTAEIRRDAALKGLYVVLHSSLSGVFNNAMVERVGADVFVPKFHPDDLVRAVLKYYDDPEMGSVPR
ncbi:chemotaxis protein [Endothiovibrio diazotrophicus]